MLGSKSRMQHTAHLLVCMYICAIDNSSQSIYDVADDADGRNKDFMIQAKMTAVAAKMVRNRMLQENSSKRPQAYQHNRRIQWPEIKSHQLHHDDHNHHHHCHCHGNELDDSI